MSLLDNLIESLLLEAAALSKGSQRVFADKKLVAGLADAVRDDSQSNPAAFPPGSKNNFKKATDEAIAQWFLENIDQIEREGYEGVVYSRDGVNADWIVRRYIAGSHSWEDLTGVMNMNLRDWYLLKNRDMLDANHRDLPKFNSVRDVGYYMTTHYNEHLEKIRDAAKNAARNKMSKSIKLVDNDDYRIYTTLNRAAGCALGLGTQWCTANSNTDMHYHRYSDAAMLFQIFPYVEKKNPETGEDELGLSDTEKYQFDAGGPNFMNITDHPVPAAKVRERFPYIFADLSSALQKNKSKMEKAFAEMSIDPTLQGKDFKIKQYEIDEEIKKLHKFVDRGYFTDEARPSKTSHDDAEALPQIPQDQPQQKPQQEQQMESLKDLAKLMMEDLTLGHVVQQYKPIDGTDTTGEESPLTYGDELEEGPDMSEHVDEAFEMISSIKYMQDMGLSKASQAYMPEQLNQMSFEELKQVYDEVMGTVTEDDMMQDMEQGAQAQTGGTLGAGGVGGSGGGQYPPGTAPTMPESVEHQGNNIMEKIDKDVAAMMASLKKYDKLNESVLGMVTLSKTNVVAESEEVDEDAVDDFKAKGGKVKELPYKGDKKEKAEAGKSMGSKHIGSASGQGTRGEQRGQGANVSTGNKTGNKTAAPVVKESADSDVLEWMARFSKLGNMKGYGK